MVRRLDVERVVDSCCRGVGVVVAGFAAVSASPIENVKAEARKQAMKDMGVWNEELESLTKKMGNQAIISGTADYSFKHFAKYWERYRGIIDSKGDPQKLVDIFGVIVDETKHMLKVDTKSGMKLIPKKICKFKISNLNDTTTISGTKLLNRSHERLEVLT